MSIYLHEAIPARGYRIGVIGTSLVNDNDQVVTGPTIQSLSYGWLRWAQFYAQGMFTCPIWIDSTVYTGWEPGQTAGATRGFQGLNAGVSGQTTSQIMARKEFLTKNIDCDIIILDWGATNAISTDKDVLEAQCQEIVDYYLSHNKIVILLTTLMRSSSVWTDASFRHKANYLNNVSREIARTRRNCYLFDWNAIWVDASNANGDPLANFSRDGTHFSPIGAEIVGKGLADFLATILPAGQKRVVSQSDIFDATNNPRGNILSNPFCTGTSGSASTGATGTVASSMTLVRSSGASTVVGSKESRTNRGDWQVMTFTPSGSAVDTFLFRTASQYITHGLQPGDWVVASMEIETNNYAGFESISCQLADCDSGNSVLQQSIGMRRNNGLKWNAQARTGCIVTHPIQLGANSASFRWRCQVEFDAAVAGTPIVKCGAIEIRKVADPKAQLNFAPPTV